MSELKPSVLNIWFLTDSSCYCCCFYRETILINNEQYEEILPLLRRPGSDGGKTPTEVLLLSFVFVILSWPWFISIIMTMMHFRSFKLTCRFNANYDVWSTLISVYLRIHFFFLLMLAILSMYGIFLMKEIIMYNYKLIFFFLSNI